MSASGKSLLLYERPVLLRKDEHRNLRLAFRPGDYGFASAVNSFLLAASEIPEASLDYPVVFIGREGLPFSVGVLVGLTDRQNLFVDAEGRWLPGVHIPAFVRRYPFVLLEEGIDHFSVGFDAAYPGFGTESGDPLFEADGSSTPLLKHATGFLEGFHREMLVTRDFAEKVSALGLLVPRVVEVSSGPSKAPRILQGFHAVDPAKLAALPAKDLADLAKGPELGWIYQHLNSLRLVNRLAAKVDAASTEKAFSPAATQTVSAPAVSPSPARKTVRSSGK